MEIKFENFWNAFRYDDVSIIKLFQDEGLLFPGFGFGFIATFGLAGIGICGWQLPQSRWVCAAVLLHMLALMPVFITERYRLAALPGLCLLGVATLWMLYTHLIQRRWTQVGIQILLIAGSAWFVSQPQKDIGLWSLDYYKAGIRATDLVQESDSSRHDTVIEEHLERARRNLEIAYYYVPGNPHILFALGNVWMLRDDLEKAALLYQKALALAPPNQRSNDGILNNLGLIAMKQKNWVEATRYFQGSLQCDPESTKTWYLLAQVLLESGNHTEARQAINQALRRNPKQPQLIQLAQKISAITDAPQSPVPSPGQNP